MRIKLVLTSSAYATATGPSNDTTFTNASTPDAKTLSMPNGLPDNNDSSIDSNSLRRTRSSAKSGNLRSLAESAETPSRSVTARPSRFRRSNIIDLTATVNYSRQASPSKATQTTLSKRVSEADSSQPTKLTTMNGHQKNPLQHLIISKPLTSRREHTKVEKQGSKFVVTGVNWSEEIPFPVDNAGDIMRVIAHHTNIIREHELETTASSVIETPSESPNPAQTTKRKRSPISTKPSPEPSAVISAPTRASVKGNFHTMGKFRRTSFTSTLGKRKLTRRTSLAEVQGQDNALSTDDENDTKVAKRSNSPKPAPKTSIRLKLSPPAAATSAAAAAAAADADADAAVTPTTTTTNIKLRLKSRHDLATTSQTESQPSTSAGNSEEDGPIAFTPRKRRRYPSIRLQDLT